MAVDGHIVSSALMLGPEQIYLGGTHYFGGKKRPYGSFQAYLHLLCLCLGEVIILSSGLILRSHFPLSWNMEMLNASR